MAKLRKRGKVWYSDIYIGGKRIIHALDTDKRLAEERLACLIEQRNASKFSRPSINPTWQDFKSKYKNVLNTMSKVTQLAHKRAICLFEDLYPITHMSQISPHLLDQLQAKWVNQKRGKYVIVKDIKSLKSIFRRAESWGMLKKQDWESVKTKKMPRGRLYFYNHDNFVKLVKMLPGPYKTVAMLGGRAGLRRGEIAYLQWQDIDFPMNRIHIASKEDWQPKDNERRWVPMTEDLRQYLKTIKSSPELYVLGSKHTPGGLTSVYRMHIKRLGFQGSIHTLRHTFGAHLAIAGVRLETIRDLMGHDSTKTTEIYSHLLPESSNDAINLLPKMDLVAEVVASSSENVSPTGQIDGDAFRPRTTYILAFSDGNSRNQEEPTRT